MNDVQTSHVIEQERLLSLIEYAKQSALLRINPVKDITSHKMFHHFEHELQGTPGIRLNTGGEREEIWLVVERLWETQPPQPADKGLILWLDLSNKPEKEPSLKQAIELKELKEHYIVSENLRSNAANEGKQLILLSDFEHRKQIEEQLKNYLKNQWYPWGIEEKKRRRTIKFYSELFTLKQELEGAITDAQIELIWGMGIGLWKTQEFNINYPLISQYLRL